MKIFRTMLCTLCQNCLSYSICNYVASTALLGTLFALYLFFPCIFIALEYYHVLHREFLCAKRVQTLIFCIIVIRNGLNTKHSLHSRLNFTFLSNLVNLLLTGNNMCHSQPMPQFFIIINASCSINLF